MPRRAVSFCAWAGCRALVPSKYCSAHAEQARKRDEAQRRRLDAERGTAAQRGYGSRWQKAREGFLRSHPLCQCDDCQEGKKRLLPATVVDHIIPHKGDRKLFWDSSNWQAMAAQCHDKKTAREDGGFGNRRA